MKFLHNWLFSEEDSNPKFKQADAVLVTIVICLCAILGIQQLYHYKYNPSTESEYTTESEEYITMPTTSYNTDLMEEI